MSTTKNTGVWIGNTQTTPGRVDPDTGVRCFFLSKPHQGTSTGDAFVNNIHEVFYFADCQHISNSTYNQKISLAMMEGFGVVGGFTNFMPLCGIERRSDPQDRVCPLGQNADGSCVRDSINQNYPNDNGDREIITRQCIEQGFLVPEGQWSGNLYEAWPASLEVVSSGGREIISGINLLFDVENANRYYYPETLKAQRGYANPAAPKNVGYSMDLCYDRSLASQGRQYRGGPCDWSTNYGQITNITWDDPRSGFTGTNRGMYFQPAKVDNASGPATWYTDPFGKNAQTTPFAGSIRQYIEPKNLNYSTLIGGRAIDPRVNNREHVGTGVHAPN